jgi:hypothetical protein
MTTTTSIFHVKPDFYDSKDECLKGAKEIDQTNPRYKNFKQAHFTVGDEEQFEYYRDATNSDPCIQDISLKSNLFEEYKNYPDIYWDKYKNLQADAVINTFRYLFYKFKKGIFVKIVDNKLRVFLPFSNANYVNEWSHKVKVDTSKYANMNDFLQHIQELEGYKFNPRYVNENIDEWYANNCLVRYEYPIHEGDSNVGNVKNMLEELCSTRSIPNIEFFINRRDFPLLTRDGFEPYNNMFGRNYPLVSHSYDKYAPVLSMASSDYYADIETPTWEDWARVQSYENKWFPKSCREYNQTFNTPWKDKKPTAVFRGGTTGCGTTIESNPRLKLAYISSQQTVDKEKAPYLDAGITNWNLRPRKHENNDFLQTIEIKKLPFGLSSRLSPAEQSEYKYIVNVDGHVSAFRLSLELSMGSVILLVKSSWKIWYSNLLVPYEHYVPIKEDLSDLIDQIKWCRENDSKCEQIAVNAKLFFDTFLQKNGILDYMQKLFVDLKNETGAYLYNVKSPLETMIQEEHSSLDFSYPGTTKTTKNITKVPVVSRSYGFLQGIEWIIRKVIIEDNFEDVAVLKESIFKNKLGTVTGFELAGYPLVVKTTSEKYKKYEHVHETYICTKELNNLSKFIPNFAYVFGLYTKLDTYNVVVERIIGETLHEYINSSRFDFKEYLFIVMQICLALQVAQKRCGFVHNDLTPWNIVLKRLDIPITIEYILEYDKIIRIRTSIIPVIIDYGKSHVIHNGVHHGFVNMFRSSKIQDVVTLLVTTIDQIMSKRLQQKDFSNLIKLANFLSETKYHPTKFNTAKDMRTFFNRARKYTNLIANNKYELEKLEPYDLIKHIMKMRDDYTFQLGIVKDIKTTFDNENSRQVFDYILSSTTEERIQSYVNVFVRMKFCTIPQPNNLFFVYFAAQHLESNILSVNVSMLSFLKREKVSNISQYEKIFSDTINFIRRVYDQKITKASNNGDEDVDYKITGDFDRLVVAPYTEDTFLLPKVVLDMLNVYDQETTKINELSSLSKLVKLVEYKEMMENVLVNQGTYKLNDTDKVKFMKTFQKLLSLNSFNLLNNIANNITLHVLSKMIYSNDYYVLLKEIEGKEHLHTCSYALEYLKIYEKFIN